MIGAYYTRRVYLYTLAAVLAVESSSVYPRTMLNQRDRISILIIIYARPTGYVGTVRNEIIARYVFRTKNARRPPWRITVTPTDTLRAHHHRHGHYHYYVEDDGRLFGFRIAG